MSRRQHRQTGFTIIELMIATVVFATVMILITTGVLSFTRSYYKGINQSNTQSAARSIVEDISQAIQFSGATVTSPILQSTTGNPKSSGICLGSRRYSFVLGQQVIDGSPNSALHQGAHSLVVDTPGDCGGMTAQDLTATLTGGSVEMMQPNMRLSKLKVQQVSGATNLWQVTVRVVYGDDDLLNNPDGEDASCKVSISGSQYCAQAELSTTVQKRLVQ